MSSHYPYPPKTWLQYPYLRFNPWNRSTAPVTARGKPTGHPTGDSSRVELRRIGGVSSMVIHGVWNGVWWCFEWRFEWCFDGDSWLMASDYQWLSMMNGGWWMILNLMVINGACGKANATNQPQVITVFLGGISIVPKWSVWLSRRHGAKAHNAGHVWPGLFSHCRNCIPLERKRKHNWTFSSFDPGISWSHQPLVVVDAFLPRNKPCLPPKSPKSINITMVLQMLFIDSLNDFDQTQVLQPKHVKASSVVMYSFWINFGSKWAATPWVCLDVGILVVPLVGLEW